MKKLNKLIIGLFALVAFVAFGMIPGSSVHAAEASSEWKSINFGDTIKAGSTIKLNGNTGCLTGENCDDMSMINDWINDNFDSFSEFIASENVIEVESELSELYTYTPSDQSYASNYECVYEYHYQIDIIDFVFRFGYAQEIRTPCGDNWFNDLSVIFDSLDIFIDGDPFICRVNMDYTCPELCGYGIIETIDSEVTYITSNDIFIDDESNDSLYAYLIHVLTDSFVYQAPYEEPSYPTYAFPGAVAEIPFSSIKIGDPISTILDENASEEDYEHHLDQLGDWFMSFEQLDVNNYSKMFVLKGTYTGVEYKLWFEVNISGDTIGYNVYLQDESKVNHLLGITCATGNSLFEPKITNASNEYMFSERVTIYSDSGWYYEDIEGSSTIECDERQEEYLGCLGINAIDYGDIIAPTINTDLHIISSTDAPLSINEILNMIIVKDETDGDISQNVTLVSTTYDPHNLVLGKHPFNVSVSDAAGNEATATFYVTVYDVTDPVIDGINSYSQSYDDPITLDDILANLTVTDNFDEELTINLVKDYYTGSESIVGSYNVIFNATDTAGNTCADYIVNVKVFDKKAPIVTAPDNIECGNDKLLTLPEIQSKISVIDGCYGKLEYTINGYDAYRATYSTVKQYPITITATDKSGNATNHTIVLEVKDEVEPKFFIAKNFVISITAGEVITNDMIISFLTQVGEIRKADVDFVQASYEDAEGEYEVLVFMKDASVYKTSIRVGTQEVEIEEKVGFWAKVGNWFKSIPNFFTKSIPNFFTKTIPSWFKGLCEKISNWWNNLWPWTKDKEPSEEPEVENEPSIEGEPALALEPAITMTVTDEFVVYEYPEFECDPGVPATMPELA